MLNSNNDIEIIEKIFFSYLNNNVKRVLDNKQKFVHYTTAECAKSIIENQEIWLRNVTCMNDYQEINYGRKLLINLFSRPYIQNYLNNIIKAIDPNKNINDFFHICNNYIMNLEQKTYIFCLSEHDKDEDKIGRLSMWRGYSNMSGTALVLNSHFLNYETLIKNYIFLCIPVIYSDKQYILNLVRILRNLRKYISLMKKYDISKLFNMLSIVFCCNIISLKHRGFKEEREWRIFLSYFSDEKKYSINENDRNINIKREIETIRGIPQIIYKIPLEQFIFISNDDNCLLDKIIIGPTNSASVLFETFRELLSKKITNPEKYIDISDIPFRYSI